MKKVRPLQRPTELSNAKSTRLQRPAELSNAKSSRLQRPTELSNAKSSRLQRLAELSNAKSSRLIAVFTERNKHVPFSMTIGNVELMHECSSEHFRMGKVRLKLKSNFALLSESEKSKYHSVRLYEIWNSSTSVFLNTSAGNRNNEIRQRNRKSVYGKYSGHEKKVPTA